MSPQEDFIRLLSSPAYESSAIRPSSLLTRSSIAAVLATVSAVSWSANPLVHRRHLLVLLGLLRHAVSARAHVGLHSPHHRCHPRCRHLPDLGRCRPNLRLHQCARVLVATAPRNLLG